MFKDNSKTKVKKKKEWANAAGRQNNNKPCANFNLHFLIPLLVDDENNNTITRKTKSAEKKERTNYWILTLLLFFLHNMPPSSAQKIKKKLLEIDCSIILSSQLAPMKWFNKILYKSTALSLYLEKFEGLCL